MLAVLPGVNAATVWGTFARGDLSGMKAVMEVDTFATCDEPTFETCDILIGVECEEKEVSGKDGAPPGRD